MKALETAMTGIRIGLILILLVSVEMLLGLGTVITPTLTPTITLGLIIIAVILVGPQYGFVFIVFLLPFQNDVFAVFRIGSTVLRPFEVVSLAFFLAWFVHAAFIHRRNLFTPTGLEWPLFTFVGWCLLSVVWTSNVAGYISKVIQLTFGILFIYTAVYWIDSLTRLKHVLWAWLAVGFLAAFWALIEYFALGAFRSTSIDTEPLNFAEHLNYPVIMGLILIRLSRKGIVRTLIGAIVLIMILGHICTGARGPFLALIMGVVFFVLQTFRISNVIVWIIPFGGIILLLLLSTDIAQTFFSRFYRLFEVGTTDVGVRFRLYVWSTVLLLFLGQPIIGLGLGSLEQILPIVATKTEKASVIAQNPYLEILVSLGIVGIALLIWLGIRIIKIIRQELKGEIPDELRTVLIGLSSALVVKALSMNYGVFIEDEFLWIILGLILASVRLSKKALVNRSSGQSSIPLSGKPRV
jgi:O-antigen ligase